jgi:hypothetical protein
MAAIHRLTDTAQASGKTVDFIAGPLKRRAGAWQIMPTGDGYVTETFGLTANGTESAIMGEVQKLSELIEQNRLYWEEASYRDPVWYECSTTSESAAKRALVVEIGLVPITEERLATPLLGGTDALFEITITRLEEWEDTAGNYPATNVTLSTIGGALGMAAVSGSYPSRIDYIDFQDTNAGTLYKVWAGIRPTGSGTASFSPVWALNKGSMANDAATEADSAGYNGTIVKITFSGTSTMADRVSVSVGSIAANNSYDHFAGRYLVLSRCYVNTGTATIQMKSGYGTVLAPSDYREITNTTYKYTPLGEVLIPPMGNYVNSPFSGSAINKTFRIAMYAERNSAAGSLYLDCLVMIPSDHYTVSIGNTIGVDNSGYTQHYTFEDGKHAAVALDASSNPNANLEVGFRNWEMPIGGGLLVVAAERGTAQVKTDTFEVTIHTIHRHRFYND